MLEHARIAVVVPAYNEARHIEATLRSVPPFVDRVFVIDDGSADATSRRASAVRDPRVRVVRHERNLGVGAALRTGYEHAFAEGADVVAVMAGDAQMDAGDLEALLRPVLAGEAEYTKGDRLSHPEVRARMPLARFVGNRVLSMLTRASTGLAVRDSQCGYTALHRHAGARLPLSRLWPGYGYPNDLLGMLVQAGARVRDVVVRPIYADETSGIRLHHALVIIPYLLARIVLRRIAASALGATRKLDRSEPAPLCLASSEPTAATPERHLPAA